jgi:hypothetical protein
MTTEDFITELFCKVDDVMKAVRKHPQSQLYPGELVTIGILFAWKGVSEHAFYRWLSRDCEKLFPHLLERTRLFRALKTHRDWAERFLVAPSLLSLADTYGVELLHPRREGRCPDQLGDKGKSNLRWIVGAKLGFVLDHLGLFVALDCNLASVHDSAFRPMIAALDGQTVVLVDSGFHGQTGDPANMKVCRRGTWNTRMLVETVLSMLTLVCHLKKVAHIVSRITSACAWPLSPRLLISLFSGMVYCLMTPALSSFPLLSSPYELAPKVM